MPIYIIFAFLALLFFAAANILLKFTAKHKIRNPLVFYFYYLFVYFLLGLLIPIFKPVDFLPTDFIAFKPVIFRSLTNFFGLFFFFSALYKLDLTTYAPLYNFQNIFTAILAFLFLSETITPDKAPWLLLIFVAGFFVNMDERMSIRAFFQKPTLGFLIYVFGNSLASIFTNQGVASVGYWDLLFYCFVYGFILPIFFLLPKICKQLKISSSQFWPVLASAALEFIAVLFIVKALAQNVIISTVIGTLPATSIFTYIISRFKPELLEYHTTKVYVIRLAATFLMLIAVTILVL